VQISKHFLEPELLHLFTNISFHEKENHKSLDSVTLEPECEEYLCKLVKEGHANVITIIRQNCLQFYITAAEKIRKRLPINNIFLHKLHKYLKHI